MSEPSAAPEERNRVNHGFEAVMEIRARRRIEQARNALNGWIDPDIRDLGPEGWLAMIQEAAPSEDTA